MDEMPATQPETEVNSRISMWKKILLGVALFIAIIFSVVYWVTAAPARVAKDYLFSLKSGVSAEDLYAQTAKTFKEGTTLDAFKEALVNNDIFTSITKVNFTSRSVEDNVATMIGSVEAKNGASPITVELINEDGDWKVGYISFEPQTLQGEESELDGTEPDEELIEEQPEEQEATSSL